MESHSSIGASSAERWMACPGSVNLCKKAPAEQKSVYAEEGSAAHELAELCLLNQTEASSYLGAKMKNGIDVTEEMAEAVNVYLEAIKDYRARDKYIQLVEIKFDLSCIYPGLFGTADCALVSSDMKKLVIFDYKHGAGKPVDVVENKQLMYYALGAVNYCHVVKEWIDEPSIFGWDQSFESVELVIVQPRCRHKDGEVRSWTLPISRLNTFADELREAAQITEKVDAELNPGSHCRWCRAMPICSAIVNRAGELAEVDFASSPVKFPAPDSLEVDKIGKILEFSEIFSDWLKSVEAHAFNLAEQGVCIPGYKLVKKKANRAWVSENEAADKLGLILSDDKIWTKKLISPAQAETLIGKSKKALLADLIVVPDNGNTLAPESDKRPAVAASALADFSN